MKHFSGIVQVGARRGTALGFPTANIPYHDPDVSGIYAAMMKVSERECRVAVYADQKRKVLEVHILDANLDLYWKEIEIELQKKIRKGKVFENDTTLRAAIVEDIKAVRDYFSKQA